MSLWYCHCCRRLRLRTGLLSLSNQSLQDEGMAVPYSDNPSVQNGGVITMQNTANGGVFHSPTGCSEYIITNSETHIGASTPQAGLCGTIKNEDTAMLVSNEDNTRATFIAAINAGTHKTGKKTKHKNRGYLPSEGSDTTRIAENSEEIDMKDVVPAANI